LDIRQERFAAAALRQGRCMPLHSARGGGGAFRLTGSAKIPRKVAFHTPVALPENLEHADDRRVLQTVEVSSGV